MDRFEDLRAFVQVVESGNLTRAAQALQVATSAVSRRIKDLEERLGTQLLQRTTRQMRLTASGEAFHVRARDILHALEEAEAEAGESARTLSGPLRVAAPLSFGHSHLAPLLIEFACLNPAVRLDVDLSDRFVDLVAEGHDLAVRIGRLKDSSLIARKLAGVQTVLAGSPSFWARHGMPKAPDDLSGLPALRYSGTSAWSDRLSFRDANGEQCDIPVDWVMNSTNGELLREAAIAGVGLVVQPSFILRDAVVRGDLVPALTDCQWPSLEIHVVYPETRYLTARARAFVDFLRDRIGPRPAWEDFLAPPAG